MKNTLKFLGTQSVKLCAVAMVATIGFLATGCPTTTNGGNGDPSTSIVVIVTPSTVTVPQGGQRQFTAMVEPAGVSQTVTWTIEPANSGIIDNGLFTPTAAPGTQVIVRAIATDTTVYGTAIVTVGQPVTPASITVAPATAYVGQGGQQQFTATVWPEGAPQAVTWSVAPEGAGTITTGGLLTVTGASVGDTLTIMATAVNHPTVSNTATVTVPEPIVITVTGIPLEYQGRWMNIELRHPGTGEMVAVGSGSVSGFSATFTLLKDWHGGHQFAAPGDYEVRLTVHPSVYRIAEMNIRAGAGEIPFSTFTLIPPITVTVTGIPPRYHGSYGLVILGIPGTGNVVAYGSTVEITGASVTFTVRGAVPGTYDVFLAFSRLMELWWYLPLEVYVESARNITASNNISFDPFIAAPPSITITITITEIPSQYQNGFGRLRLSGDVERYGLDWGLSETEVTGSSATFRFWFINLGIYEVWFRIEGSDRWGDGSAPAMNLTANTSISWSAFNFYGGGEPMPITITGIPDRYHGNWGELALTSPYTGSWGASHSVFVEGSSATFRLAFGPGVSGIELLLNSGQATYLLWPRNIYAGMSIPLDEFTFAYWVVRNLERSTSHH